MKPCGRIYDLWFFCVFTFETPVSLAQGQVHTQVFVSHFSLMLAYASL